jgi:ubiquinone/menaquinone biosynthesis C-methylase UbiE
MLQVFKTAAEVAFRNLLPEKYKEKHELDFWRGRHAAEKGQLSNSHFEKYYTTFFGIEPAFYTGKRIIDIGCGPRGSLEWADMAAERVGLDSLAKEYMKLGADRHKMKYIDSGAENIPFPTGHFDAAFSFNSLDHVRDIDMTLAEIKRIVKPGGVLLLITELGHEPTPTEPQTFSFEILDRFAPQFELVSSVACEMLNGRVYESIQAGRPYDRNNPPPGRAILCARFERKSSV